MTWATGTASSPVDIEITLDGVTFLALVLGTTNDGSESVTTPLTPSPTVRVRVTETSTGMSDASDADFMISGTQVTSPNGGETWFPGEVQSVTWISVGASSTVDILYSIDGSTWFPLAGPTENDGAEDILVPAAPSSTARVRVTDSAGPAADDSDADFVISGFMADVEAGLPGIILGCLRWGDYDGDGDMDIAASGSTDTGVTSRIYRNDGGGSFVDILAPLLPAYDVSLAWGDYDRDGDLDLTLTGMSSGPAKIYRNAGSDSFLDTATPVGWARNCGIAWVDFDNDGDLDHCIAGGETYLPEFHLRRQDAGGVFTDLPTAITPLALSNVAWADFDADGDQDALVLGLVSGLGETSRIYRNDGAGTFVDVGAGLPGVTDPSAEWGDYDNDGDLDLAICGATAGGASYLVKIFRNDAGTFTDILTPLPSFSDGSLAWGDFDNDGDLDLLIAGHVGIGVRILQFVRNDGGDLFRPVDSTMTGRSDASLSLADHDGDGDLDVLAAGWTVSDGYKTDVYRNDIARPNAAPGAPAGLSAIPGPGSVVVSWTPATDDHTPSPGLSYNIRVGSSPGSADVVSPMADIVTGKRRLAALGPSQSTSAWLDLAPGTYFWSVQAIDTSRLGGAWAAEGTFTIP